MFYTSHKFTSCSCTDRRRTDDGKFQQFRCREFPIVSSKNELKFIFQHWASNGHTVTDDGKFQQFRCREIPTVSMPGNSNSFDVGKFRQFRCREFPIVSSKNELEFIL